SHIAAGAEAGDAVCAMALQRHQQQLAYALSQVVNVLDPQVVVLGGGLSQISGLYQSVSALWVEHIFSDLIQTRLLPPVHGDASGVRGAARLWPPGASYPA